MKILSGDFSGGLGIRALLCVKVCLTEFKLLFKERFDKLSFGGSVLLEALLKFFREGGKRATEGFEITNLEFLSAEFSALDMIDLMFEASVEERFFLILVLMGFLLSLMRKALISSMRERDEALLIEFFANGLFLELDYFICGAS